MLLKTKYWLDEHPSEVIVLDFGGIEYSGDTVPALGNNFIKTLNYIKLIIEITITHIFLDHQRAFPHAFN